MRYLVLAALMFVAGLALTRLEREPQTFTPVVRVRTENGLFITLLQRAVQKRSVCAAAVETLVVGFDKACAQCSIESTECAAKLEGVEAALARKEPVPFHVVASDEIRIGILGPPKSVEAQCERMASMMANGGVKSATCVRPAAPS
jgi:hypothetical protein